jgi:hypothetical protein
MVTPSGSPAWVRNAGITDYGGATDKANYMSQGVINPRTDVGAAAFMRMAEALKSCATTGAFCVGHVTCNDAVPAAPTINACLIMPSGKAAVAYEGDAAPTGFPSFARNGTGDVTGTWASSYTDAYGVAGAFAPAMAFGGADSASNLNVPALVSGQTVQFSMFTADTGAAIADSSFSFIVF